MGKLTFNHEGNYVCECGKRFTNSQSFNGHKVHCSEHRANKNNTAYWELIDKNRNDKSKDALIKLWEQRKQDKANLWAADGHRCKKCGKAMTIKFGSGRYCSRSCANSREHTQETKDKISSSLLKRDPQSKKSSKRICIICGGEIPKESKSKVCSYLCKEKWIINKYKKACSIAEALRADANKQRGKEHEELTDEQVKLLREELDDDNKLREKYRNKRVNAQKEGMSCNLTFAEYMLLAKEAGIKSSDIGFSGKKYVLARYNDQGNYTYGNCRFITQYNNSREKIISFESYKKWSR